MAKVKVDEVTNEAGTAAPNFPFGLKNNGVDAGIHLTSEVVATGQSWSGIDFVDAGLNGTPDTGFSTTGAKIYPDGTIVGKSDLGIYVKRPDRTLVGRRNAQSFDFTAGGTSATFTGNQYPHDFAVAPTIHSNMQGVTGSEIAKVGVDRAYNASPSTFTYNVAATTGNTFIAGTSFIIDFSFEGEW
jgi:hypothetical protein